MRRRAQVMKKFALLIVLSTTAVPADAQSLQVIGYAGVLGEWELTATVTTADLRRTDEFSGPLTMRHTGLCTQDGPEEKTGDLRLQVSPASRRLQATLRVAGVACSYSGKLSGSYSGMLICPDRPAVPLMLWVR
jgi:hypothetical protein